MNGEGKGSLGYRVAKSVFFVIFLLFLSIVLLGIGGRSAFVIEIPIRFFLGWVVHAWKALPHLLGKWQEAVVPVGCLLMAAVIAHRFVCRWVEEKFPNRIWRKLHTAGVLSLLLLGSAAAIAASGVVHQMFWLGKGDLLESNRRIHLTVAKNNGMQLMWAILEFHDEKGRYPHTLEELEVPPELIWVNVSDGRALEPFVLLRTGSAEVAFDEDALIVSPLMENGEMVVVGYGDFSVRAIPAKNLKKVLGQDVTEKSEGGR